MRVSPVGAIAHALWYQIPFHHPGVRLDAFVVMPNHIHGILVLDPLPGGTAGGTVGSGHALIIPPANPEPSVHSGEPPKPLPPGATRYQNIGKRSVSSIVLSYKSAVTRHAHEIGLKGTVWQTRFHDHIIREVDAFERIAGYIERNPAAWHDDCFHRPHGAGTHF